MRSRTLIAALVVAVVVAAAPHAASRQSASPRLYLIVAGYRASVGMSPSGSLIGECRAYCRFVFPAGTTSVTLTAQPATGTTFIGWRKAFARLPSPCSGTAPACTVNLGSLVAVKAAFNPVSLSVRSSGGGGVSFLENRPPCGDDCRRYNYDTNAHLQANAEAGFVLKSWTGCTPSGPTCAVRMNANRIVNAQFGCLPGPTCKQRYPVTHLTKVSVKVVGHGRVLGPQLNCPPVNCTRNDVERGSTISLRAKPNSGSLFGGWIKLVAAPCSTQAERCTFPVFKDSAGKTPELHAYFKKAPPPPPPPKPPPPPRPPPPPQPPPPSPPPPPPPPQPVRCRVPKVRGMRLGRAKARIRSRHCSVGRIRRAHSKPSLRRRVIRQRPPAGAVRRRGFPVKLVVGRR